MTRAEGFREFVKNSYSLAESIDLLPELPEGLGVDYLERVQAEMPVADDPYEPSCIRDGGLKIWDSVYLPVPKAISVNIRRQRDLASLRSINAEWEKTKEALGMVGRPDGVHYLRPKGPYILDMMNDDLRMLQGAHILAHRAYVEPAKDEYTFGQASDIFLRSLIKLFIARKYGLVINTHPEKYVQDSFSLYGIEVFGSTDLRSPVMVVPTGKTSRLIRDKTVVTVLGSIGIEAHPSQAMKSDKWREINKWSCLPTLVALAGWECVDYVMHSEYVEIAGEMCHAVPCSDLQPISSFDELLQTGKSKFGVPEENAFSMTVDKWFSSDDFANGLSITPTLPCPFCIRINEKAEGVVKRPRTRKPKCSLKEAKTSSIPEVKEWVDYVSFVKGCIDIGRSATTHALRSVTTVKRRNLAFNKRLKTLKKISSLTDRYARKVANGFLSEAESINTEIEKLKKEIEQ